jgi:hypothetical protein
MAMVDQIKFVGKDEGMLLEILGERGSEEKIDQPKAEGEDKRREEKANDGFKWNELR